MTVPAVGALPPVALLLPGQGAQHPGMAVELYGREPVFTAVLDEFFARLGAEGALLRSDWLSERPRVPLDEAARAQPLLFAVGYALGRALAARGVRPAVLLGHSVGELAAAALAGVFGLGDVHRVMAARAEALAGAPAGGMLAVGAPAREVAGFTDPPDRPDAVVVAAVNAPRHTVLAGPEPRLSRVAEALGEAGLPWRRVPARQPFHSPALEPAAAVFSRGLREVALRPPDVPIRSTRTGLPLLPGQARDPAFWGGQLAAPVLFWPALDGLLSEGAYTLVEAGPGQGLSTPARRHPAVRAGRSVVLPLLPAGRAGTLRRWEETVDRLSRPGT
ncbi:acyltransferase domain-containing protein [Bailinhaonella thermotolerans]|uniref:Acyltransferase domain-containing protein n=1 Tax=Bailinhaonella thermotolerans TaxID=1070861 RepID=A0A3A4BCQ7_9ACTN|nr:acyltransferase domain-containing protein [Bailinhaonella thermotolerans]RJL35886.1 acyltransferase domain-containing protein [Bailinhaonella thermotolerans]